ncbi:GNAT family N-acetyltransferase [Erythrobacter sp. KMU-140]|uniref:GNAT family N-acetyltransferase n=1 Tax=Erythrobacter rubeus TaxID=2760803 RepID=A0ABR8KQY7_9SPHN|nr:GNAT family N-acetyltransferase [Erythrobacter rubeus]
MAVAETLEVRPVRSADADQLADLLNAIIRAGGTTALEEPFSADALDQKYLTGPDVLDCFVAEGPASGELVGFQTLVTSSSLPGDVADIATFAQSGATQRGIGTSLFAATSARARELGLEEINATIRADNTGGLAFYSKMGFEDHSVTESVPLADGTLVDRVHKRFALRPEGKSKKSGRKTLGLKDTSNTEPNLNKKGRGWKISDARLDELHSQARERRRFSSEAHKALAKRFAEANLGRHTFKRHAVVGSAIVDFNCHSLGMAVDIFEDGDNEQLASRRDKSLEAVGIKVMRIRASDILEDMDKVLERITLGMRARISDRKDAARAHREANPNQDYPGRRS